VTNVLLDSTPASYFGRNRNMQYHNLCTTLTPPPGIDSVLGYDLKHCIQHRTPRPHLDETFSRFARDVRIKYTYRGVPDTEFDPKLYVKNVLWQPERASDTIEQELRDFEAAVRALTSANRPRQRSNLNPRQLEILLELQNDKRFIIGATDKNLGPFIIERDEYIKRCFDDHLLNSSTYKRLTREEANLIRYNTQSYITRLIAKAGKVTPAQPIAAIDKANLAYFNRSYNLARIRRPPQFYLMFKVHKPTLKTRPVVSCCGSFPEIASKWLDYQLSLVVTLCPSHTKDSTQIIDDIARLGRLPPNAYLFTSDAVSMYTNIDTDHGLQTITKWLELHEDDLPPGFPTETIIDLLARVMKYNVFQLDDCWFQQTNGTAMGTSVACVYATIYYSYHEETRLLPKYSPTPILFYRRFIDDVFSIWLVPPIGGTTLWNEFTTEMNNFGSLKWEAEPLSKTVNFLDLTIEITNDGEIKTKTFQKAMNLYLYLCPSSAHPPGVLKGLIFGSLQRYWRQNSATTDYQHMVHKLYDHLRDRGHREEDITPIFHEAARRLDTDGPNNTVFQLTFQAAATGHTLYFHAQYHPADVPRSDIRHAFNTCCPTLQSEIDIADFTIAYSRQPNLRDKLSKTQLVEPAGNRASDALLTLSPLVLEPSTHTNT
jgi:hypothetical protein